MRAGVASQPDSDLSKDIQAMSKALGGRTSNKEPLTPFQWGLAFDVFAIAASVTDMWPYEAAVAHKHLCIKIGHEGRGKGLGPQLCVIYDEVGCCTWSLLTSHPLPPCSFPYSRRAEELGYTYIQR